MTDRTKAKQGPGDSLPDEIRLDDEWVEEAEQARRRHTNPQPDGIDEEYLAI